MRHHSALASFLVLLALASAACAQAARTPVFRDPPRLAITAEELAAVKAAADFAAKRDAMAKSAEELLAKPPVLPEGYAEWSFYYACPDDGTDLNAISLTEHECGKCKKRYTDDRTVAAYRAWLHYALERATETFGWAYAYTGDDRFAAGAQRILLKLADDYKSYPDRRDRWGRTGMMARLGGRRFVQSLDEAVGTVRLAKGYDLTRTSKVWTDAQRKHVEEDFFRATGDTLLRFNQDINNHQTWYNAGLMCIASVLGDAAMVERVLTMKGGFDDQLARSVGEDGLWYEGTIAYHNYALQAMVEIADAGRRMGLPLHEAPKFRLMIEGPARAAYPDGRFPAINDSDPASVDVFRWAYDWAAKVYNEPDFATKTGVVPTKSDVLEESGLAILRQGEGKEAVCAMMDFGPHGGGHGHFDKLGIMLFANGREWLLDPGRLTYSHKEYKTWVKETAAHNTVALGGRSQAATTGKLVWVREGDAPERWTACAAESDKAYDGALLRRCLLLTPTMLVDVFDVSTPEVTQIDWLAHALSENVTIEGDPLTLTPASPGNENGYQHFTEGMSLVAQGNTTWSFKAGNARLTVHLHHDQPETLFTAKGIGYHTSQLVPTLIRRREAKQTRFVTVYDLSGKGDAVRRVREGEGGAIVIDTPGGPRSVSFTPGGVSVR
jgi:hypothetical protein